MLTDEAAMRQAVIAEAVTWLGTPFHHAADVKGGGVDCAMFMLSVYKALGLVPQSLDPRPYPFDWHMHNDAECFIKWIEQYGIEVAAPAPADIVLYKYGRCHSHGGIVIDWPGRIIHSYAMIGCVFAEGLGGNLAQVLDVESGRMVERSRRFYTLKSWSGQ